MSDIVERLRNTPNWMREAFGSWKSAMLSYDRTPFEAADEIEKLRAALREIKRRTQDAHPMSYVADYWRIANDALGEKE